MATQVYDTFELILQDKTEVEVKPLPVKLLRKFMVVMEKIGTASSDDDTLDLLIEACGIALSKQLGAKANNKEELEDLLDLPTMWKIVEVAGGIQLNPTLLVPQTVQDGSD